MASTELEIIVTAVDKTGNALGKVTSGIASLGKVALGVGVAGLTAVGAGTAVLGKQLIGLGSDAEEMQGKFDVVFAQTGAMVTKELDTFSAAVGRSKFELRGYAATIGDTLKPMGFAEAEAANLSSEIVKLAVDLGSFNNMETTEALQRLQGGLIGNHENLLAFGVRINEAILQEELMAMGMDDLTGAALEQAKAQARLNIIMRGTTDAQGDAARTSNSWANQMRALQATITDTATEMGQKLLPVVTPILQKFGEFVRRIAPLVIQKFEEFIKIVVALGNYFKWVFLEGDYVTDFLTHLPKPMRGVVKAIGEFITNLIALGNYFKWVFLEGDAWNDFLTHMSPEIRGIVKSIGIFIANLREYAIGIFDALKTGFSAFKSLFAGDFDGFLKGMREAWEIAWNAIKTFFTPILQSLWDTLKSSFARLQEWFKSVDWKAVALHVVERIKTGLSTLWSTVVPIMQEYWLKFTTWFRNVDWKAEALHLINQIGIGLKNLWATVQPIIHDWYTRFVNWFKSVDWKAEALNLVNQIGTGLKTIWNIARPILEDWRNRFVTWFKSVDWKQEALNVVQSIKEGLSNLWDRVQPTLSEWWTRFKDWVANTNFFELGRNISQRLILGLANLAFNIIPELQKLKLAIFNYFDVTNWGDLGVKIVFGLIKGIVGLNWLIFQTIAGLAQGVIDAFAAALGIRSPSRVFAQFGQQISKGLTLGITSTMGDPVNATNTMASGVVGAAQNTINKVTNINQTWNIQTSRVDAMPESKAAQQFAMGGI